MSLTDLVYGDPENGGANGDGSIITERSQSIDCLADSSITSPVSN